MKKYILLILVMLPVVLLAQVPEPEPSIGLKFMKFFDELNIISVLLVFVSIFFGGLYVAGRTKLKQIGDLFLKAYEYTDDKRLSNDERNDLINRFMEIIGKRKGIDNPATNGKKDPG